MNPEPAGYGTRREEGFTLVEIVVGVLLVAILIGAVAQSVFVSRRLTYANAQRVGAFGMCKSRLEELRGMEYSVLRTNTFSTETNLKFMHLSGRDRVPVSCTRSITLEEEDDPPRLNVNVTVNWNYLGQALSESVDGVIFDK